MPTTKADCIECGVSMDLSKNKAGDLISCPKCKANWAVVTSKDGLDIDFPESEDEEKSDAV